MNVLVRDAVAYACAALRGFHAPAAVFRIVLLALDLCPVCTRLQSLLPPRVLRWEFPTCR